MGNEPSIGSPWAYLSAGAPWKAQLVIRDVMTQLWGDTPDGIAGNDDLGTMSAWYVWCALGLYPQNASVPALDVGTPLFPYTAIRVPGGTSLDIVAAGASDTTAYVRSVRFDGAAWSRSWIPFSDTKPLHIDIAVSASPDPQWAAAPDDAPPSFASGAVKFPAYSAASLVAPSPDQLTLAPGESASFRFSISDASAKPESISWSASAVDPLAVTPLAGRVDAAGATATSVNATVAADRHAADGLYDFAVSGVADNGAALVHVTGVVRVMRPGHRPPALAYVANFFDNEVAPFDPRTHAIGQPILVGELPREIAISPDGKRVYAADNGANKVSVIDTASQSVIATVDVGRSPWGIRVSPNSSTVWVANGGDNTVQAIDASTLATKPAIAVGTNPEDLAISPDGSMLYVDDVASDDVTPVDTRIGTALPPIPAGPHPRGIAISPDGKRLAGAVHNRASWRRYVSYFFPLVCGEPSHVIVLHNQQLDPPSRNHHRPRHPQCHDDPGTGRFLVSHFRSPRWRGISVGWWGRIRGHRADSLCASLFPARGSGRSTAVFDRQEPSTGEGFADP